MKAEEFGKYIKSLRNKKGFTIRQLEVYSGVSNSYLSQLENGKRGIPTPAIIKKLYGPLEVEYDELMRKAGHYLESEDKTESSGRLSGGETLTEKDERDIAKRMEKLREDLKNGEGLSFSGEPMSEEAIESLLEAMEYAERQTTRINKKYIPKKYRDK